MALNWSVGWARESNLWAGWVGVDLEGVVVPVDGADMVGGSGCHEDESGNW